MVSMIVFPFAVSLLVLVSGATAVVLTVTVVSDATVVGDVVAELTSMPTAPGRVENIEQKTKNENK